MKLILENWRTFLLERKGVFVDGFKQISGFDFDEFYAKLDKAGLTHLLGSRGKDYEYGRLHDKARQELEKLEDGGALPKTINITKLQAPQPARRMSGPATREGKSIQGKSLANQNRSYSIYVPAGVDLSNATLMLYFHGRGSSHRKINRLKDNMPMTNSILVVPSLTSRPDNDGINVSPSFIDDVIEQVSNEYDQNVRLGGIQTYAHSAGGKPMGNFLSSLGSNLGQVLGINYLDASYGWNATKKLMTILTSIGYDTSRIHFIFKNGSRTARHAKKYADLGVRLTGTDLGHNKIAYQINV